MKGAAVGFVVNKASVQHCGIPAACIVHIAQPEALNLLHTARDIPSLSSNIVIRRQSSPNLFFIIPFSDAITFLPHMNNPSSGSGGGEDSEAPHLDPDRLPANENPHLTQYEHCPPVYPDIESKFDLNDYCYADADYEPSAKQPDPTSCDFSKGSHTSSRSISQVSRQYSAQKHDEIPGANYPMQSHADSSPYNLQHPYYLEVSGVLDRMEISVHQQRDTKQRHHDPNSKYGPYTGQFDSTESASQYRKQATRFNRKPYRPPDTDDTIAEVERNRKYHVERIYNAMTRGDAARDNKGSIAMKRWVHGAYYKADLVEAYSHKVLDCLLLQAKEGFRGWVRISLRENPIEDTWLMIELRCIMTMSQTIAKEKMKTVM